ncbi:MAG TPA: hypothetical protein VLS89_02350, partial [Candidatus Nanopelagicales bacterium]|nr:hypothetical protein [Candidatus Nanopelagicales bacterium]
MSQDGAPENGAPGSPGLDVGVEREGEGVRLYNPATDRCLTVVTGEVVVLATACSISNPFQRWRFVAVEEGVHEIVSVGLSEDVGGDV